MNAKLKSEVDEPRARRAFELLRESCPHFHSWRKRDVKTLLQYMKIFSFQKNTPITKRGEKVDFMGIFLSGSALIQLGDKKFGYMKMGDFVGYMAFLEIPGCEKQTFNVLGDTEGYIAVLSLDYLRLMHKRDPQLILMLIKLCAKLSLENNDYQLLEKWPKKAIELKKGTLKKSKILEMFKHNVFGQFLCSIDSKSRKKITKIANLVKYDLEGSLFRQNTPVDHIVLIVEGRLQKFKDGHPSDIVSKGEILGFREFLYELEWEWDLVALRGEIIVINKDALNDLLESNAKAGFALFNFLMETACQSLRCPHKHELKKQDIQDLGAFFMDSQDEEGADDEDRKNTQDEINKVKNLDFLEINIRKKRIVNIDADKEKKTSQPIRPFRGTIGIPPIFKHPVFEAWIGPDNVEKEDIQMMKLESEKGPCQFLQGKIKKQAEENKAKKKEMRQRRKEGFRPPPNEEAQLKKKKQKLYHKMDPKDIENMEALEVEHETLKNEFNLLEMDYNQVKEQNDLTLKSLRLLRQEIKQLNLQNKSLKVRKNLYLVHDELQDYHANKEENYKTKLLDLMGAGGSNLKEVVS